MTGSAPVLGAHEHYPDVFALIGRRDREIAKASERLEHAPDAVEISRGVRNAGGDPLTVVIEPSGMRHTLAPGERMCVVDRGAPRTRGSGSRAPGVR